MPKTQLGKWSVKLIALFFVLFVLTQTIAALGRSQGALDSQSINVYRILIPVFIIPAGLAAIAAFIVGLMSIIKLKERSWLVYLASVIGFLVLIFVLGEFIFPH